MNYKKLFPHKGDSTKSIRPNKGNFKKLKSRIIMELYEYSDDELKKEIRRRAKEKAYKTRMENKFNRYSYWYGVVTKITTPTYSKGIYEIEFSIDGNEEFLKWKRFKLARGFGFSKKKLPNVGDKVKLRYRNGKGFTAVIYNSKIIEIIDK